jgi:hypothetical protein
VSFHLNCVYTSCLILNKNRGARAELYEFSTDFVMDFPCTSLGGSVEYL